MTLIELKEQIEASDMEEDIKFELCDLINHYKCMTDEPWHGDEDTYCNCRICIRGGEFNEIQENPEDKKHAA